MHADSAPALEREVQVPADGAALPGNIVLPPSARGLVIFAHGSGSGRFSPRNLQVAATLQRSGLGTFLFDLLQEAEERDRRNVFDIDLLGRRLASATSWVSAQPESAELAIGYFGASTGAAAALWAAGDGGGSVKAIVSRGGRPDLAGDALAKVEAPTLLIVGGDDRVVLDLNRQTREQLRCPSELVVVPGASHLFEEPGTLEAVAEHARNWFARHLA